VASAPLPALHYQRMLDLIRQLERLEELRTDLRSKATAHYELADGFDSECRDVERDIALLLQQIQREALPNPTIAPDVLSLAEKAVYDLMKEDYTHKQIGLKLGITERTSKWHAGNIYNKLKVPKEGRRMGTRSQRLLRFRNLSKEGHAS
jgi:DNA-binding CsgD family transcriptional regulator